MGNLDLSILAKEGDMAEVFGYELVARALQNEGVDTMFFIMGGPMLGAQDTCRKLGLRMIDVRHEQAAAMMANAYARLTGKPGVCSTASGPAATNLLTGLAHHELPQWLEARGERHVTVDLLVHIGREALVVRLLEHRAHGEQV